MLPYLPFLAVMLAVSLRHWLDLAATWRGLVERGSTRGAGAVANAVLKRVPEFAAGPAGASAPKGVGAEVGDSREPMAKETTPQGVE